MVKTYAERVENFQNETARKLLQCIERKKSNLCVAVDVTKKSELLDIVDKVGPYICLLKTHVDIIEDFDEDLIVELRALSESHDFMIFEDRKFADIGNTVALQYSAGIYKISSWAHITNAHTIPGEGIITGLAQIGNPLGRGLLLLAEMSSAGSLAIGSYTDATVTMARKHKDFVIGFIAGRKLTGDDEDFVVMSPGVGLDVSGDPLGQRYRTPEDVIVSSGSDIIIVGRGIYGNGRDVVDEAKRYRDAGWKAYLTKLGLLKVD